MPTYIIKRKTVILLFFCALMLYSVPVAMKRGILTVPDETVYVLTARNLINNGSFYIRDINYELNEKYHTNIFGRKLFNYLPGKGMAGQYPFGMALLLALFSLGKVNLMVYMVPFMGAVGVCLFYLLNKQYFNKETAFYAALLLMVMPGYWYWATYTMTDVPGVVIFLAALFCLEKFFSTQKIKWMGICGFLLGFGVCLKYASVITLPPVMIYFFLQKDRMQKTARAFIIGSISFLIPISMLMLYHQVMFGGPFITGYHVSKLRNKMIFDAHKVQQAQAGLARFSVMPTNVKAFTKHILGFPLQMAVALPYVLFGLVSLILAFKRNTKLFLFISILVGIVVLFHANIGNTFGYSSEEMTLHSSYLRYLLLVFTLLIIPTVCFIGSVSFSRKAKVFIILILFCSSISNNISSIPRHNLRLNYKKTFPLAREEKRVILSKVPERSVIIADYAMKYNLSNRAVISPRGVDFEEIMVMVEMLLNDNTSLYYKEDWYETEKLEFFIATVKKKEINEKIHLFQINHH